MTNVIGADMWPLCYEPLECSLPKARSLLPALLRDV
jgi:hypothetical protein